MLGRLGILASVLLAALLIASFVALMLSGGSVGAGHIFWAIFLGVLAVAIFLVGAVYAMAPRSFGETRSGQLIKACVVRPAVVIAVLLGALVALPLVAVLLKWAVLFFYRL